MIKVVISQQILDSQRMKMIFKYHLAALSCLELVEIASLSIKILIANVEYRILAENQWCCSELGLTIPGMP